MKPKTTTLTLLAMLLAALLMSGIATAEYPMFHRGPERTGDAFGYAPVTGNLLWKTDVSQTGSGFIGSGASVADGRLYVTNWPSKGLAPGLGIHCVNVADGSVIWSNPIGKSGSVSTPAIEIGGDRLFVGSKDEGELYCINKTTGDTIWKIAIENDPGYYGLASSPLINDGTVYVVSFSDGRLHAIDFNGTEEWSYRTEGGSDWYMSAAADGSRLFFGGGNAMNCVDLATHAEAWTYSVGGKVTTTPAVRDGVVYFATAKPDKTLYAVDVATGSLIWSTDLAGSLSSPAVSGGRVYIGDKDERINCFDARSGSMIWNRTLGGPCMSSPVVAGGMVYVTANYGRGTIYGFDAEAGVLEWSYDTGNWNIAQPSVSDGMLFVGSDTGCLYAFSDMVWEGSVAPGSGTLDLIADNSGKEYPINGSSALAALIRAADAGGFNYTINDSWYDDYGSLRPDSIAGRSEEGGDGWLYWVNYPDEPSPSRTADHVELSGGDVVTWYYGGMETVPDETDMLIWVRIEGGSDHGQEGEDAVHAARGSGGSGIVAAISEFIAKIVGFLGMAALEPENHIQKTDNQYSPSIDWGEKLSRIAEKDERVQELIDGNPFSMPYGIVKNESYAEIFLRMGGISYNKNF